MAATDDELQRLTEAAESAADAARWDEAVSAYQRLLTRFPAQADSWYNFGLLLKRLRQFEPALRAYQEALDRNVAHPEEVRLNRSVIYADHLRDPTSAERELLAALESNRRYVPALLNLANLREDQGDRDAARTLYQEILRIDPRVWEAMARDANLAEIAKSDDPVLTRLAKSLLEPDVPMQARASLAFALGRGLDAAGSYDAAFTAYTRANEYSRASAPAGTAPYDRAAHSRLTDRIISAFAAPSMRFPVRASPAVAPPVFICGMFRSGSTLAEQVLAAHPRVTAGGELDWLPSIVASLLAPFPDAIVTASDAQLDQAALAYLANRANVFPGADVLTDKRPDNFLFIGLIKTLFPDAKIVHTVRQPLDNCLSVYFLHLDHRKSYATDLADIAHYYGEYRRLMAHWRRLYPQDIFDFDYDRFVLDQRGATEELLAFCGIEWDERCLAFHEAKSAVKTASVWQVRKPLYQRSSNRWRNYAKHLQPVANNLG
jgi:tetratricopeptide (TPR) repeat protein